MAKGEQRGNREAKKPKKEKPNDRCGSKHEEPNAIGNGNASQEVAE
jgi:hypothetical protein